MLLYTLLTFLSRGARIRSFLKNTKKREVRQIMRRRDFVALLFAGIIGSVFPPRICFADFGKRIIIRRDWLRGGAYEENGILLLDFPILYGDDEGYLATPAGVYRVREKIINYHSKKYDSPMPYSLFFTRGRNAIHARKSGFKVPEDFETRRWIRTHGCITADHHIAKQLYSWANIGTPIEIIGNRI